jgi:membrane protein
MVPAPANGRSHARRGDPHGFGLGRAFGLAFSAVGRWAWKPEHRGAGGLQGQAFRAVRVAWLAARGLARDHCGLRAAALTYITVFSLAPLLALSFAAAKGLGLYESLIHENVRPMLDRTFGPAAGGESTSHALRRVIDELLGFVDRTDVRALGIFGLLLVLWTGLKLLAAIEGTLNDIWGAERPRNLVRRLADYLAMVVVPPILLAAATAGLAAARTASGADGPDPSAGAPWFAYLARVLPFLSIWFVFAFLYTAMPNARTRLASATLGALVAALLWQAALVLHIHFQVGVARYSAIYSSFAAVPIFLVWLNVSWMIVLFGAELCFAHQSEPSYVEPPGERQDERGLLEVVGLRSAALLSVDFLRGAPPPSTPSLASRLELPEPTVVSALERLVAAGLVAPVDGAEQQRWVLARDPSVLRVEQVLAALGGGGERAVIPARSEVDAVADGVLRGLDEDLSSSRHNLTLRELGEATRSEAQLTGASLSPAQPPAVPRSDSMRDDPAAPGFERPSRQVV